MESTRRSSNRQQKIPNHFHDSVHDLNKNKGITKNKGTSIKEKKIGDCLDKAVKECLGEGINQEDVVDGNCDSQKVASGHKVGTTMGKVIDDKGGEKLDNGGNVDVEKVVFGSIDDTIFASDDGSNKVNIP
ncbi:hypothetical protein Tco_0945927, partial [Tanacetum coccineum]